MPLRAWRNMPPRRLGKMASVGKQREAAPALAHPSPAVQVCLRPRGRGKSLQGVGERGGGSGEALAAQRHRWGREGGGRTETEFHSLPTLDRAAGAGSDRGPDTPPSCRKLRSAGGEARRGGSPKCRAVEWSSLCSDPSTHFLAPSLLSHGGKGGVTVW